MPDGLSRRPEGEDKEESETDDFDEGEYWIKSHPGFGLKEVNTGKVGKLSINKSNIKIPIKQEEFWKKYSGIFEYFAKATKYWRRILQQNQKNISKFSSRRREAEKKKSRASTNS
ncbi:hypothetical protein O181_107060 [Austropuccinia psidii MF-1]|uniref:Uncharacterized protein n=1 Tax=Austropuccinia psidii MF-1 TaxID=1389203 RepID=A0A9Q3JPT0_9BASI|nr:hypothetical protein [Austropuccinia psidii MF-1]